MPICHPRFNRSPHNTKQQRRKKGRTKDIDTKQHKKEKWRRKKMCTQQQKMPICHPRFNRSPRQSSSHTSFQRSWLWLPEIADVRRKDKCGLTILLLEVISGASPPFPHKAKALPVHIFTLKIGHFWLEPGHKWASQCQAVKVVSWTSSPSSTGANIVTPQEWGKNWEEGGPWRWRWWRGGGERSWACRRPRRPWGQAEPAQEVDREARGGTDPGERNTSIEVKPKLQAFHNGSSFGVDLWQLWWLSCHTDSKEGDSAVIHNIYV